MTVTIAMLAAIVERLPGERGSFDSFAAANPELFDRHYLLGHYTNERLECPLARRTFLLPDRPMPLSRWILGFRVIFVGFLIVASATAAAGGQEHRGQFGAALEVLGASEIAAALLFLFRRTQAVGLAALLAVFAIAFVLSIFAGEMPLRFLYYAATATFIFVTDRHNAFVLAGAPR